MAKIDLNKIINDIIPALVSVGKEDHADQNYYECLNSICNELKKPGITDERIALLQMALCDDFNKELSYANYNPLSLYSEAYDIMMVSHPHDIDTCELSYNYGITLYNEAKYNDAIFKFNKSLQLYQDLQLEDKEFKAQIIYWIAESKHSLIFEKREYSYGELDECRRLFEESHGLYKFLSNTAEQDETIDSLEDTLTDIYEMLSESRVSDEWADRALSAMNKRISSMEEGEDPDSIPTMFEIERYQAKLRILKHIGNAIEIEAFEDTVNKKLQAYENYRKKCHQDYLSNLIFPNSYKSIKAKGYIESDETFDAPLHGVPGDEMRELFGDNWNCAAGYSPNKTELPYDIFLYECPSQFIVENNGDVIIQEHLSCLLEGKYENGEVLTRKVAIFTDFSKKEPTASSWKMEDTAVRFYGIYSCTYTDNKFIFNRISNRIDF